MEFQHYLITTNSLRKSFLSIKGIYYQATVQGQDILWIVPHKFVPRVTADVDYRIMGTFVEFYTTLLGFVNYRLYSSIGLVYPPKFDAKSDEEGGELAALTIEGKTIEEPARIEAQTNGDINGHSSPKKIPEDIVPEVQKEVATIDETPDPNVDTDQPVEDIADFEINDGIDTFERAGNNADVLPQPQASSDEAASLFAPYTFFLSRETPRQPLEFILRAFGCKSIAWDAVLGDGAFTNDEGDTTITHQIVDRPPIAAASEEFDAAADTDKSKSLIVRPGYRMPGRIYIQPQWIWDCINEVKLLRPDIYAPGVTLPPHLSPWIKPTKGGYDPTIPLADQEREGEAEEAEELDAESDEELNAEEKVETQADDDENGVLPTQMTDPLPGDSIDDNGMQVAGSDSDSAASATSATSSFAGFDNDANDSEPEDDEDRLYQRELEAEAAGLTVTEAAKAAGAPTLKGILKNKNKAARKAEEEELERRKMMIGNKKRKVYEKMRYSNNAKDVKAEKLRAKRRRIEAGKKEVAR